MISVCRFTVRAIAAVGVMTCLTWVQGCALPRERKELLGAEPRLSAGAPAMEGMPTVGSSPNAGAPAPAPSASTSSSSGTPGPAADGGVTTTPTATNTRPDASTPADAGPDECGDKFSECLFADPLAFESCAMKFCRALVPMNAAVSVPDGGLTKEAACAMQFADCLTKNPQMTAECMAKAQQCM